MNKKQTEIRDLAVIGDRRTVALVASDGAIVWYCPGRFDRPSLFAALLDPDKGGAWTLDLPDDRPAHRTYIEESGVLETRFELGHGELTVTDWMSTSDTGPRGICRLFSPPPQPVGMNVQPAPDYAAGNVRLRAVAGGVCINDRHWLYASHPLVMTEEAIRLELPEGQDGWAILTDAPVQEPNGLLLQAWRDATLAEWREIASQVTYRGPFEREVAQSLRALRLLTHVPNGGVIAAATTSLPEIRGGARNYDYRYVWMRDAAMIVSALVRAGSNGLGERRFLEFICGSKHEAAGKPLLPPFLSLDLEPAPDVTQLDLGGYAGSRPVRVGNGANHQLQLDGFGNVLLAAKLIYGRHETREHWETIEQIADFLAAHWHEPDYGIWEEHEARQYTVGKVIVSCGLRYIADFSDNASQAERWRAAANDVQSYIAARCINSEGAYAAFAGGEAVDVSAALFPTWGYTPADSAEMLATMRVLERDCAKDGLYWRHLEELGRFEEGAFLAGTLWVAQYWVLRKDLPRARRMLETALEYATDLGFFAEEADPGPRTMLGNFPQTFVHSSFIGAVIDYRQALIESGRRSPNPF